MLLSCRVLCLGAKPRWPYVILERNVIEILNPNVRHKEQPNKPIMPGKLRSESLWCCKGGLKPHCSWDYCLEMAAGAKDWPYVGHWPRFTEVCRSRQTRAERITTMDWTEVRRCSARGICGRLRLALFRSCNTIRCWYNPQPPLFKESCTGANPWLIHDHALPAQSLPSALSSGGRKLVLRDVRKGTTWWPLTLLLCRVCGAEADCD